MSNPSTITIYATAFLASLSLFGLVDAGRAGEGARVAGAITQAYLLPILWISSATFLTVTIIALSRSYLNRPHRWNSEMVEKLALEAGLAGACYFGVLAMISYFFALIAPGWLTGLAPALARYAAWFIAVPCLLFGAFSPKNQSGWMAAGAVFVTIGLFTG